MKRRLIVGIVLTLAGACFFSCKNDLLPAPSGTQVQSSRSIAPAGLEASNGRQKIYLTWGTVDGAQGYWVYGSGLLTPTESSFERITYVAATSASPSYEIEVKPGSQSWYRVSAVLFNGNETVCGTAVRGTSLATPEITAIEPDESNATTMTVYWNMTNCRADTYRALVEYELQCTGADGTATCIQTAEQLGGETRYAFTGLNPHTEYAFKVIARNRDYGDEQESLSLTKETLHQMQPRPPLGLAASTGTFTDRVRLSFALPEKADLQSKEDASFARAPMYFAVYRRPAQDSSAEWQQVTERATVCKKDDGSALTTAEYPDDGGLAVYIDDIVGDDGMLRGVLYEYKVQSHLDTQAFMTANGIANEATLKKNYTYIQTSDTMSAATSTGYKMAQPAFSTRNFAAELESESSDKYKSASVQFTLDWPNFLLGDTQNAALADQFAFLLYEKMTPFDCDTEKKSERITFLKAFPTVAAIAEYTKGFDLVGAAESDRGQYAYTVCIASKDYPAPSENASVEAIPGTSTDGIFDMVNAPATLSVSDSAEKIEDFTVTDGYSDTFVISWKNVSGKTYALTYFGTDGIEQAIEGFAYTTNGGTATFSHGIPEAERQQGVTRTYRLTASDTTSVPISSVSSQVQSLGIPQVRFDTSTPKYDSITVTWSQVQKATSYTIALDGGTPVTVDAGEGGNATVSNATGVDVYTYTFTAEQLGANYYGDATQSGTDKAITVSAQSGETAGGGTTQTAGTTPARTLGPALAGLTATVAQDYDAITVQWNQIAGAKGYKLLRTRYAWGGTDWQQDEDTAEEFYIDAATLSVQNNGDGYGAMTVSASGNALVLTDAYKAAPADQPSQADITQERIPWGIPVQYAVYPVLSSGDTRTYGNMQSVAQKGAAIGYGQGITATKATSASSVTLRWAPPYRDGSTAAIPVVYRRPRGSSAEYSQYIKASGLTWDNLQKECSDSAEEERGSAYEYAVKYQVNGKSDDTPFVPSFVSSLAQKQDTNGEPQNVGYQFFIKTFRAENASQGQEEGFTETVSWSPWDYAQRANGPQAKDGVLYTIWQKNLNNSANWFKVAEVRADGTIVPCAESWYETSIDPAYNGINLTPQNVSDAGGTNNGLLKVQRDYKHYYMIRAQRTVGDKTLYTYRGLGNDTSTYRRISPEEFAKNVLLVVADAIHVAGDDGTISGETGKFIVESPYYYEFGHMRTHYHFNYSCTDYTHKFTAMPTNASGMKSYFKLNYVSRDEEGESYGNVAYLLGKTELSVTGADNTTASLKSYRGTIKFRAGNYNRKTDKTFSLDGWYSINNGNSISLPSVNNNKEQFEAWFPFLIGENLKTRKGSSYNADFPSCNGNWWLVRSGGTPDSGFPEDE